MFPLELEQAAFRATNGEYGWTREQIPLVIPVLRRNQLAIVRGELWWVRPGIAGWTGLIPRRGGLGSIYHWQTERLPAEPWSQYVERAAANCLEAVACLLPPDDLPTDFPGRILYNLMWVSEEEYDR